MNNDKEAYIFEWISDLFGWLVQNIVYMYMNCKRGIDCMLALITNNLMYEFLQIV